MAHKKQKFISHSLETGKPEIKVPVDGVSGGSSLPGFIIAVFLLDTLWGFFPKDPDPISEGSTLMT